MHMTPTLLQDFTLSPDIVVGHDEYRRLTILALAGAGHAPEVSDSLLYELDRATVIPDGRVPRDVVRMGSSVRFRTSQGEERDVHLVYPADANITLGRISVMTPVGAALVGLTAGQSITWQARDGRRHALTVLAVRPPLPVEPEDPGLTAG
jgi:regulator of nucleoside diphosphate kinase